MIQFPILTNETIVLQLLTLPRLLHFTAVRCRRLRLLLRGLLHLKCIVTLALFYLVCQSRIFQR